MEVGHTVYTVNNKTNQVDSWTYKGVLRTPDALLVRLEKDKKYLYLPEKCVFLTKNEALAIINKS